MKKLVVFIGVIICINTSYSQSKFVYNFREKVISKTQLDSLIKVHNDNLTYAYARVNGQTIVNVSIKKDTLNTSRMTFSNSQMPTNAIVSSKSNDQRIKKYMDESGGVITEEVFKSRSKNEGLQMRYAITGDSIFYYLMSHDESASLDNRKREIKDRMRNHLVDTEIDNYQFKSLGEETVSMKDLKDKVVVLNLWFTGCAPCIREIPDLNSLVGEFKSQGVEFLASTFEKKEIVNRFMDSRRFDYQIMHDGQSIHNSIFSKLISESEKSKGENMTIYPVHMVVDKEGMIRYVSFGANEEVISSLSDVIKRYLN